MAYQNDGYEMDWNGAIENDSPSFTLLPEGDYDFVVTELERTRHNGSAKLPPCNKAIVHIRIDAQGAEGGMNIIKHNLFLHSRCEGLLCDFFVGIGQRQKGERKNMDWSKVVGARGRAKVGIRTYNKDGQEYQANEIKRFYSPGPQNQQKQSTTLPWPEATGSQQPPYNDEVF